ncbi:MAG: sodium:solute symporter family protein [Rhodothermales bacterium]
MENQVMSDLGQMAYFVLAGYLLLLLGIGFVGYKRSQVGEEDYYLAGRGQGWLVSSLTIMATFFSSFALLGAPGMVYRDGVVFALFALNVPLSGAMIYVLGSKIHRIGKARGFVTPADMLCDYYESPVALRLLVAVTGFLYAVPYVVMQIQAGGILAEQLFPGDNSFVVGAILLSLITMLYIMIGGMRSVAWTDVIQGGLLVFGMLVAGAATVAVLGGVSGFFQSVAELPATSLSVPGTTGYWTPEMLFTVCFFASMGSMVQPAQWMRYYSASSTSTLRRSAVIFTVVLTMCFLFGIMLVGLGGQVLYPIQTGGPVVLPNPAVGTAPGQFDQILVVLIKNHLPQLLGVAGSALAAIIMVAIMAAAMSTADSNLHALSAIITRDIYDRFIDPTASEARRTWVGRLIIFFATGLALLIVIVSRTSATVNLVGMIAQLGLLAIAFSSQLLPMAFDMLFIKRGTRQGAVAGIVVGLGIVFLLSPLWPSILGGGSDALTQFRTILDIGAWGLLANVVVFGVVSAMTRQQPVSETKLGA